MISDTLLLKAANAECSLRKAVAEQVKAGKRMFFVLKQLLECSGTINGGL
jgi:hypothetical protein